MMPGSSSQVFIMPGAGHGHYHHLAGGEDPRYPFGCPSCERVFASAKALHGHMRSHQERPWRGMEPPRPPPLGELGPDGRRYPYVCDRCRTPFQTRQALGGHRASHSGRKGCSRLERQELAAAEEARKPIVFHVDLNLPAPEEEE